MAWSVTSQFGTISKAVGGTVPEWNAIVECTEEEARHWFQTWTSSKQLSRRTIILWDDKEIVEVKFV